MTLNENITFSTYHCMIKVTIKQNCKTFTKKVNIQVLCIKHYVAHKNLKEKTRSGEKNNEQILYMHRLNHWIKNT